MSTHKHNIERYCSNHRKCSVETSEHLHSTHFLHFLLFLHRIHVSKVLKWVTYIPNGLKCVSNRFILWKLCFAKHSFVGDSKQLFLSLNSLFHSFSLYLALFCSLSLSHFIYSKALKTFCLRLLLKIVYFAVIFNQNGAFIIVCNFNCIFHVSNIQTTVSFIASSTPFTS